MHLCDLLKYALNLRSSGSGSPLRVLASIDLNLQHLELCEVAVSQVDLNELIQNNVGSIGFIRCLKVRLLSTNSTRPILVNLSLDFGILDFFTIEILASPYVLCSQE